MRHIKRTATPIRHFKCCFVSWFECLRYLLDYNNCFRSGQSTPSPQRSLMIINWERSKGSLGEWGWGVGVEWNGWLNKGEGLKKGRSLSEGGSGWVKTFKSPDWSRLFCFVICRCNTLYALWKLDKWIHVCAKIWNLFRVLSVLSCRISHEWESEISGSTQWNKCHISTCCYVYYMKILLLP